MPLLTLYFLIGSPLEFADYFSEVRNAQPATDAAGAQDDFEYVMDVTKFKSKAEWAEDPYKKVPTAVKSAFTR